VISPSAENMHCISADDQYIRIFKNKLIELKSKKTGRCD
jgi:hypothetical protein